MTKTIIDSISEDDLFSAFGLSTSASAPKSASGSLDIILDGSSPDLSDSELSSNDLIGAFVGGASVKVDSVRGPKTERDREREAQIEEMKLRSREWKRELARQNEMNASLHETLTRGAEPARGASAATTTAATAVTSESMSGSASASTKKPVSGTFAAAGNAAAADGFASRAHQSTTWDNPASMTSPLTQNGRMRADADVANGLSSASSSVEGLPAKKADAASLQAFDGRASGNAGVASSRVVEASAQGSARCSSSTAAAVSAASASAGFQGKPDSDSSQSTVRGGTVSANPRTRALEAARVSAQDAALADRQSFTVSRDTVSETKAVKSEERRTSESHAKEREGLRQGAVAHAHAENAEADSKPSFKVHSDTSISGAQSSSDPKPMQRDPKFAASRAFQSDSTRNAAQRVSAQVAEPLRSDAGNREPRSPEVEPRRETSPLGVALIVVAVLFVLIAVSLLTGLWDISNL